jgi:hypothetical protein
MHKWETESWEHMRRTRNDAQSNSYHSIVLQRMDDIFRKFCTAKDRPYGRQGSFQHPPEYDPSTEEILEVVEESPRRVVIKTKQHSAFQNFCQYVLVSQRGTWRIDSRKFVRSDGSTFSSVL